MSHRRPLVESLISPSLTTVMRDPEGASPPAFAWMMCWAEPSKDPAISNAISSGLPPRAASAEAVLYSVGTIGFVLSTGNSVSGIGGAVELAPDPVWTGASFFEQRISGLPYPRQLSLPPGVPRRNRCAPGTTSHCRKVRDTSVIHCLTRDQRWRVGPEKGDDHLVFRITVASIPVRPLFRDQPVARLKFGNARAICVFSAGTGVALFQHSLRPLIQPRCSGFSTGGCSLVAFLDAAAYTPANLRSNAGNSSSLHISSSILPEALPQSNEGPSAMAVPAICQTPEASISTSVINTRFTAR